STFLFICFLLFCSTFFSCKNEISKQIILPNTDEFILADSLQISVVAAEPLVANPVVMQFDLAGRIWVVELPGYMRNIDGEDEDFPDGNIIVLIDEDQDGVHEKRHVFLDSLVAPRAIAHVYNGLLYTNNTSLFFTEINADLQPENTVLVDSLYVVGGNIEHRPNGLLYHMDNWIYSAKSNARYRRKNGQWEKEATTARGQWGITHDDSGRLIYNDNSNPLVGDYVAPNRIINHKYQKIQYNLYQQIAPDPRVFPYQPTAMNRGYSDGTLDLENRLCNFSSACSPLVYRGTNLAADYYGNAFVCGPEVNLVKRYDLSQTKEGLPTAEMHYDSTEWLVSKDETFRPVDLKHGMDGGLYVLDMRKGIIQHHAYMSSYLRDLVEKNGLDTINNRGRIYRISQPKDQETTYPNLTEMPLSFFLGWLQHPSGYYRQLAQQQLVFNGDKNLLQPLTEIATDPRNPAAQLQAIWTLEGLDLLSYEHIERLGAGMEDLNTLSHLVQLSERFPQADFTNLYQNASQATNYIPLITELAHVLPQRKEPAAREIWQQIAKNYQNQAQVAEGLINGQKDDLTQLNAIARPARTDSLAIFIKLTKENRAADLIQTPELYTEAYEDDRTAGAKMYLNYCATCHRADGRGVQNMAPPLYNTEYLNGDPKNIVRILLHGLKGPITIYGKNYDGNQMMPGIANNDEFTDEKITALLSYLNSTFRTENNFAGGVSEEEVASIRAATANRTDMYTEEELDMEKSEIDQ
ncbi:MAG: c-type cytochrome, partial [Saprospiraceae bacterium]